MPALSKIVWAVDVLEHSDQYKNALHLIKALTRAAPAEISPVHVLSYPFSNPSWAKDFEDAYQALAEKRLVELAKNSKLVRLNKGEVLVNRQGSTRAAAEMAVGYAEENDADVIVVATHARTGVSRLFMGSFAETLLVQSNIPVLTVNPQTKVREQIKNILFPTTFQAGFREGFERVAMLAKSLDASLTAFYKEPELPSAYQALLVEEDIERKTNEQKKQAQLWSAWAEEIGISPVMHFDFDPGSVSDAIVDYAKSKDFDLIAMVSKADSFTAPVLGSTCRKVIRSSATPVWVLRTEDFGLGEVG